MVLSRRLLRNNEAYFRLSKEKNTANVLDAEKFEKLTELLRNQCMLIEWTHVSLFFEIVKEKNNECIQGRKWVIMHIELQCTVVLKKQNVFVKYKTI